LRYFTDPKKQAGRGRPKLAKTLNKSTKGTPAKKKPTAIKTNSVKPERPDDENDYVIGDNDDPYSLFYDNIVLLTDSDGDPISGPFLQLPSKKQYPDYYEDITQVIIILTKSKKFDHSQITFLSRSRSTRSVRK